MGSASNFFLLSCAHTTEQIQEFQIQTPRPESVWKAAAMETTFSLSLNMQKGKEKNLKCLKTHNIQ